MLNNEMRSLTTESVRAGFLPELEILRLLGSSPVADVFLARETLLQRLVAVKMLRPELAADQLITQRFEREAQAAARVAHSNVTAIHRIGRLADGVPFIVMEYVDGRTVADLLCDGGLALDRGRPILASVASALAAAHHRGVVHRDVRPANIFVEKQTERAVLADFGIASLLDTGAEAIERLTAVGVQLGQVRYMSPEQILGHPVTPQSDIFAFGVLSYEVMTGRGPFTADTDGQLIAAHLQNEPVPMREIRADVPEDVAALIQRCLSKEPNRRPIADELASALAMKTTNPSHATSSASADTSRLGLFREEMRRRRVYRVLAAYGAVALALLGGVSVVHDAFSMDPAVYRMIVGGTLAGFPVALLLGWVYDVEGGRILRTRSERVVGRMGPLLWGAVALSVVVAGILGWLILRPV